MITNNSNYKEIGSANTYAIKACPVCGRRIEKGCGYYIGQSARQLGLDGNASYIHTTCKDNGRRYHTNIDNSVHGNKRSTCYNGCLYGLEIEVNRYDDKVYEYLQANGWNAERDSSLEEGGLEWKHGMMNSFSHYSKILHGLEKIYNIMSTEYASAHFTISTGNKEHDGEVLEFIRHYRKSIVNYFQDKAINETNIERFGRGYHSRWARRYTNTSGQDNDKYMWINLTHVDNGSIEFRINKFNGHNATELLKVMKEERAFYLACVRAYDKYGNTRRAVQEVQKWVDKNY